MTLMELATQDITTEENFAPVVTLRQVYPIRSRAQQIVYDLLNEIEVGSLIIEDHQKSRTVFGTPGASPQAELKVHHPSFFEKIIQGGSLALGESYMAGWWDVSGDNLVNLFKVIFSNRLEYRVKGNLKLMLRLLVQRYMTNPRFLQTAKKDIQMHYDLGNDFFKQILDSSMTYSCGYLKNEDDSLEDMQRQKYDRICTKLGLEKGGSILDIGCGWGGMLIHAAKKYPQITGVGITLSEEQYQYAHERIQEEGLADRISVHLCDYRTFTGRFDFIVSIGMFEHIGYDCYPVFFKKVNQFLKDDGVALLHTIGLEEDPSIPTDPWIGKYIFPGSRLPRLEELTREMRRAGLLAGHIENLHSHYAHTLRSWKERFRAQWPEIRKLSEDFNLKFYRMWNYYLQICEACYDDSTLELYQVLFCKQRRWPLPARFEF